MNASTYEAIVRGEVIPEMEARRLPGFYAIDLVRRTAGDEVEFVTIMWFKDIESVQAFTGRYYEVTHVPPQARAVLSRFDGRSQHYEVLDRRDQQGTGPPETK